MTIHRLRIPIRYPKLLYIFGKMWFTLNAGDVIPLKRKIICNKIKKLKEVAKV